MAIKTTSNSRNRIENVKYFVNANPVTNEDDFRTWKNGLMDDATNTYSVQVVSAYYAGENHVIVAVSSYPEVSDDPTAQVPEAP